MTSVGTVVALLVVTGCSSDGEPASTNATTTEVVAVTAAPETTAVSETSAASTAPVTTEEAIPDTTVSADSAAIAGYRVVVETLASDEMAGRDNLSAGSTAAQDFLISQLSEFAQPLAEGATGPDAFRQAFGVGTNVRGDHPRHRSRRRVRDPGCALRPSWQRLHIEPAW